MIPIITSVIHVLFHMRCCQFKALLGQQDQSGIPILHPIFFSQVFDPIGLAVSYDEMVLVPTNDNGQLRAASFTVGGPFKFWLRFANCSITILRTYNFFPYPWLFRPSPPVQTYSIVSQPDDIQISFGDRVSNNTYTHSFLMLGKKGNGPDTGADFDFNN
jgi:hypothetical protein